jgi:hypothetical protein
MANTIRRNMLPKSRWIGEMEEIAKFLQPDNGGSEMLSGARRRETTSLEPG